MSKLICPKCGSEVKLPETSSLAFGMTLSKQGNDVHYLQLENENVKKKKMTKAEERIEKLKMSGINTDGYFAINDDTVVKVENGVPTVVEDDVLSQIYTNGYVKNASLHRRFVMAQMFHGLNSPNGFNNWLKGHGYEYQWKMLLHKDAGGNAGELWTLVKLEESGDKVFDERKIFFNKNVVYIMAKDYINKLKNELLFKYKVNKNGEIYVNKYGHMNINDIKKKVCDKLNDAAEEIINSTTAKELFDATYKFNGMRVKLNYYNKMDGTFINAYKASGAYYTLQNMIRFHGVVLSNYETGEVYDKYGSEEYLKTYLVEHDGYKLFSLMLRTISENNFTFGV